MKQKDISQLPVMKEGKIVGGLTESSVLSFLLDNPLNNGDKTLDTIMGEAFPVVQLDTPISQLRTYLNKKIPAVLTKSPAGSWHIVTQYDILQAV
jgi:cystathionine beta-synthase